MGIPKHLKVVVCGYEGCGKTSILEALINGRTLKEDRYPTIEDTYNAAIRHNGTTLPDRLILIDMAGSQNNKPEIPNHLACADAFVIVYSITSEVSFRCMEDWKKEIERSKEKKDAVIIILGNKLDLCAERVIDSQVAQMWASSERVRLSEVTVTQRHTLVEPFWSIATRCGSPSVRQPFASIKKEKSRKALDQR